MSGTAARARGDKVAQTGGYTPVALQVADWIRQAIIDGRLKPGERIRQEAVARECGTSRIPVREALTLLRNEGLVTYTSHVGARVATLDLAQLDEIYYLRERLEPFALAQSIPLLGDDDHVELRRQLEEMEALADAHRLMDWLKVDREFHLRSYRAAPLPEFMDLIHGYWNRTHWYRLAFIRLPQRFPLAHMEHRLLLDAIERRNPDDAALLSALHIRRTRETLHEHAAQLEDG